ncbi:MAG: polyphosphate kinase 2 [Campylobacterales bacterium]|nr:polyphosphate kinase 2 [Campylobacterales bacterium]
MDNKYIYQRPEELDVENAFKEGKLRGKFYEAEMQKLQIELVKLQNWVKAKNKKILVIFEGRDAAGKGGTIQALIEHLNPRGARVVALAKPSDVEKTQWYFQRYIKHLPDGGEIVFFDRSWYNRAGVERVMNFCTDDEYKEFLIQSPSLEQMLINSGIIFFKYFLDVSKEEQERRLDERKHDPLKRWKLSAIDEQSKKKWDEYSMAFTEMLSRTHTPYTPWIIVQSDDKKRARINIARDILSHIDYDDKDTKDVCLISDPEVLRIYSHMKFK